jgi:hypothetical protein
MSDYVFEHPRDPERLVERFEGWEADPKRVAIYGRFVLGHVASTLEKVYPACHEATPADVWARWLPLYYARRPASSRHELNELAVDFPAFVASRDDAPPFLEALARFEWAKLGVYHSQTELPREPTRLVANPTLTMIDLPWAISRWYPEREGEPVEEAEIALLWREPERRWVRYAPATSRRLLALKIAVEEIPVAEAAAAGGVEEAAVAKAVEEALERGLLLGPDTLCP